MTSVLDRIHQAFGEFAESVTLKFSALAKGEPEEQLRTPLEIFFTKIGQIISRKIVLKGESLLSERLGRPDFAVVADSLLCGYIELKAPGKGANPNRYKERDRDQWNRFRALPNLIYCDGNEWRLYRNGEREETFRLSGDVTTDGIQSVSIHDAENLKNLLLNYFSWEPIVPKKAKDLADLIAPLCWMLRQDVLEALGDSESPLHHLARDWRELLFPNASDDQFADAYAQTVTFALLLARSEGASTLGIRQSIQKLSAEHTLLSRALEVLTDSSIENEISTSLHTLQRVIDRVPESEMDETETEDPWLYFYEDFLAAYDPVLRKDTGAYYTPVEVVHAQVRLVDSLLIEKLNKPMGFAHQEVITLDPAVGTGTYLLGVIEHTLKKVEKEEGKGAIPAQATALAKNLYGFENMTGPYSVAELRVSRAFLDNGGTLPKDGPNIFLTDTLESPNTEPKQMGLLYEPIAKEHRRALKVKGHVPVIVCLGNPPYDRHEAADANDTASRARTGGWVRWNDDGNPDSALLKEFLKPAIDAGYGGDVKNLYNLYIYFWRWALWKVFEHSSAKGPGIVSFISASSYLDGNAFVGVREHMRRVCDEIWILDLGGEGRGTRKTENVFAIQTPVAIAIAVCYKKANHQKPAAVHYCLFEGTREDKLKQLEAIQSFKDVEWKDCPAEWQAPFRPAGEGVYFTWPLLTDLMPWQHSGVQLKRTWPIAPDKETLERRWKELLRTKDRASAFRETSARLIQGSYSSHPYMNKPNLPIAEITQKQDMPKILAYGYRSFDRQWIFADNRLADRIRPDLWRCHSSKQIYLTSLLYEKIGIGPALTVSSLIPDLHYFSARGAKDIVPFYRSKGDFHPNFNNSLFKYFKSKIKETDFFTYFYGILSHPGFTEKFMDELASRELRVPITKDMRLFKKVAKVGKYLIWLHTYGERFFDEEHPQGSIPTGKAKCVKCVPDSTDEYPDTFSYDETTKTLFVGKGEFKPVDPAIYHFEVSGLKVVQSWLGYRMKEGKGKKSSPLDDIRPERWTAQFTRELLELLWVLEATLDIYPQQAELLQEVLGGPLVLAEELPPIPDELRQPFQEEDVPLFTENGL